MTKVAVIDYGMGNLRSVCKAIEHVSPKASVKLVTDADGVGNADRIVFPGQGAITGCISALKKSGMFDVLEDVVHKSHFLGYVWACRRCTKPAKRVAVPDAWASCPDPCGGSLTIWSIATPARS